MEEGVRYPWELGTGHLEPADSTAQENWQEVKTETKPKQVELIACCPLHRAIFNRLTVFSFKISLSKLHYSSITSNLLPHAWSIKCR